MNDLSRLRIDRQDPPAGGGTGARRRGRRAWWLAAGGLIAAAWLTAGGGWRRLAPPPPVRVAEVVSAWPAQAVTLFNATGYVVPQTRADIASKATGRLEALEVEEGSVVRRGDVVARLENDDMRAASARARARLASSRASIDEARARLAESEARVAEAQAEVADAGRVEARAKAMVAKKFQSPEVYDAAVMRRDKAVAALRSAEAAVVAVRAAVAAAESNAVAEEAALAEAEVQLEYTLIRAPFDGVILSKQADIGDVVAPFAATVQSKGAVVSMADLGTLQVEADVAESNLTRVRVGQPCEIQLDALPDRRLRGEVHMIVPTVDRTKATVLVKVRFVDADPRVLPDMSARVAFLERALGEADREPRLLVPADAVVQGAGGPRAFRVEDGIAREAALALGAREGDRVVVEAGLAAGERVVLAPPAGLRDGAAVTIGRPE